MLSYSPPDTDSAIIYAVSINKFSAGEGCTCYHIPDAAQTTQPSIGLLWVDKAFVSERGVCAVIFPHLTQTVLFSTLLVYRDFVLESGLCAVLFPHTTQTVQFSVLLVYRHFVLQRGVCTVIFPHTTQTVEFSILLVYRHFVLERGVRHRQCNFLYC